MFVESVLIRTVCDGDCAAKFPAVREVMTIGFAEDLYSLEEIKNAVNGQ
jgi:hypothetical protein